MTPLTPYFARQKNIEYVSFPKSSQGGYFNNWFDYFDKPPGELLKKTIIEYFLTSVLSGVLFIYFHDKQCFYKYTIN